MLQQECRLLATFARVDNAKRTGRGFANAAASSLVAAAESDRRAAMPVIVSALVSDYLRCATALRYHEELHSFPNALAKERDGTDGTATAAQRHEELLASFRAGCTAAGKTCQIPAWETPQENSAAQASSLR